MVKTGKNINLIYNALSNCNILCLYCYEKIIYFEKEYGLFDVKYKYDKLYKLNKIDKYIYEINIKKLNEKYKLITNFLYTRISNI
jgi:hypothetical protein